MNKSVVAGINNVTHLELQQVVYVGVHRLDPTL